jgi:hypothetical protein
VSWPAARCFQLPTLFALFKPFLLIERCPFFSPHFEESRKHINVTQHKVLMNVLALMPNAFVQFEKKITFRTDEDLRLRYFLLRRIDAIGH